MSCALLKLPRDEARAVQKDLYRQHGTTLNGLMREHGIDPETYLDYVHDIDLSDWRRMPAWPRRIARLPGRRFVFTNGCRNHAARILDRLGMTASVRRGLGHPHHRLSCPSRTPAAYDQRGGGRRRRRRTEAAMFDDIARNLVPARALGMTTVWLKTDAPWGKHGPVMDVAARRYRP